MIGKLLLLLTAVGMSAMAKGGGGKGPRRPKGGRGGGGKSFGLTADEVDMLLNKSTTSAPPPAPSRKSGGKNGWDDRQPNEPDPRKTMPNLGDTSQRRGHILDGDKNDPTSGGHRYGTNRPGKTEFPKHWTDDQIMDMVNDVARNPDSQPLPRPNGAGYEVQGQRAGVTIRVILNADGTVWSAHPLDGGLGVKKNPR